MRCSQCGLPLSPRRNSCPRCGTPINVNISKVKSAPLSVNAFVPGNLPTGQISSREPYANMNPGNPAISTEVANRYPPPIMNWNDANTIQNPGSPNTPPITQMPFSAQEPPRIPFSPAEGLQNMSPSGPIRQMEMQATFPTLRPSPPLVSYPTNNLANRSGQPLARQPYSSTRDRSKKTKIGFTIAGLCIIAGSLLLIFVYLVGQDFFLADRTPTTSNTQQSSTVKADQSATAIYAPIPTTLPITPTPTLPRRDLLDTSVLSNNLNEQMGIQQSTTFKVNQRIYVILNLHPGGNSRAICLNWYLNGTSVNKFAFEVNPTSNYNYYSYAAMTATGNGHVDISLASDSTCADATLAQKLSFKVS